MTDAVVLVLSVVAGGGAAVAIGGAARYASAELAKARGQRDRALAGARRYLARNAQAVLHIDGTIGHFRVLEGADQEALYKVRQILQAWDE